MAMFRHWRCGWCGLCYANRKGRGNHRGHVGYVRPFVQNQYFYGVLAMLTKRTRVEPNAAPLPVPSEFKKMVDLWEMMTSPVYPDTGEVRRTASLTLFFDGVMWKGALNDRDVEEVAFLSGTTLWGLLEGLDRHLRDKTLEWKVSGFKPKKKG